QIMVAIYEANPQAFSLDNINELKAGANLTIPSNQMVAKIAVNQAQQMLAAENQQWHEFNHTHFPNRNKVTSIIPQISMLNIASQSIPTQNLKPLQLVLNKENLASMPANGNLKLQQNLAATTQAFH